MDPVVIEVAFRTPSGSPLPALLIERREAGDEVELEIEVDRPAWGRVLAEGLFGDISSSGAGFACDEDVAAAVRILLVPTERSDAGVREPLDGLLDAARWRAVEVWQPLELPPGFAGANARLSTGFRVGPAGGAPRSAASTVSGSDSVARSAATPQLDTPLLDTPLLDTVQRWLADHELQATLVEGQTVLRLDGEGVNGSWILWIETREDDDLCVVWSSWPQEIPVDRRSAVMELVTRVNTDIQVGAFELDLGRGQLSFRTSVDVTDDRLSEALLARLVGTNVETFDDYLPALDLVLAGDDPVTALQATAGG